MAPPERPDPEEEEADWIDRLTALAARLGMNEVRVRWKLMAWRDAWHRHWHRGGQTVRHARYEHKLCPRCGAVNDRELTACSSCSTRLLPLALQRVVRLLGLGGDAVNVTTLLITLMVIAYARQIAASPDDWLASVSIPSLLALGGHFPPYVVAGEWWRLGTAVFLHIGVWHLGFNCLALRVIGPPLEQAFGGARVIFLFMLTGVGANLGTQLWGLQGVSAGASGAICGLIGVAAGWGHREGTSRGRELRDLMLRWGLLTLLVGWGIGANNTAHTVGFVLGAVIGLGMKPTWHQRGVSRRDLALGFTGLLAALVCVGLILVPPRAPGETREAVLQHRMSRDADLAAWIRAQRELETALFELDRQEARRRGLVCSMCSAQASEAPDAVRFFGNRDAAVCSSCLLLTREQFGAPRPADAGDLPSPRKEPAEAPAGEGEAAALRCSFCDRTIPPDGSLRGIQGRAAHLCERCAFRGGATGSAGGP